jgi:hypothetical protein
MTIFVRIPAVEAVIDRLGLIVVIGELGVLLAQPRFQLNDQGTTTLLTHAQDGVFERRTTSKRARPACYPERSGPCEPKPPCEKSNLASASPGLR